MKNTRIHSISRFMCLGIVLLVLSDCGGSDNPIVVENTPAGDPVTVIPDDPIPVLPMGRLNGQVEKIEATQINVRVLQDGKVIASVAADADGNYQIDGVAPGTYTIEIAAKGYETVSLTAWVIADQSTPLDRVALQALAVPVAHLRGFLADRVTKQPLENVRVQLIDDAGNVREVLTKATGSFEFENLQPDQRFTLAIEHDGYEKQEIAIEPIPATETAKLTRELVPIQQMEQLPIGDGLPVGAKAPDFSLPDGDGQLYSLADYIGQKRVVLVFYRGSW